MIQDLHQIALFQRSQDKHPASGQESRIDLKRGILRRRADQNNASFLYKRQKGILLRLIKPMDLVHEQNGPKPHPPAVLRLHHDLSDLFDPTGHRAEINEISLRPTGYNACQRRFPNPRRSPEYHRRYLIPFDQLAQHLPLSDQMTLPRKFFQRLRTQTACKRRRQFPVIK